VSGYLHIPTTLCPGKYSPYFTGEKTGGPYVMPECVGEEKDLCPYWRITPPFFNLCS